MYLFTETEVQIDGPSGFVVGTALFAFEDSTASNERHEDVPWQRCELYRFQIGGLYLTRTQLVDAVGEEAVAAFEASKEVQHDEGQAWPEVKVAA